MSLLAAPLNTSIFTPVSAALVNTPFTVPVTNILLEGDWGVIATDNPVAVTSAPLALTAVEVVVWTRCLSG